MCSSDASREDLSGEPNFCKSTLRIMEVTGQKPVLGHFAVQKTISMLLSNVLRKLNCTKKLFDTLDTMAGISGNFLVKKSCDI